MPPLKKKPNESPTVRLSVSPDGQKTTERYPKSLSVSPTPRPSGSPTIRLAHAPGAQGDNNLLGRNNVERIEDETAPALLVSYVYLEAFVKNIHRYAFRDWALDSGAFSAHNSGMEIKLQDFIDCAKELMEHDTQMTEVFALDVIGDWRASLRNAEEMWRQGVPCIPCFHYGEPWDVLKGIAKDYPKIALGGCVGRRDKDKFAGQCFSKVWPKKIHGFGFGSEKSILMYPWHSVDATNWEMGPCGFGKWHAFGHMGAPTYMNWKGSRQNLRAEVEWYLALERRAREKWRKEMQKLDSEPPTFRLSLSPTFDRNHRYESGLKPKSQSQDKKGKQS